MENINCGFWSHNPDLKECYLRSKEASLNQVPAIGWTSGPKYCNKIALRVIFQAITHVPLGNRVAVSLQNNGMTFLYSSDYNQWYRTWNWDNSVEDVHGITAAVSSDNRLFFVGGQRGNDANDYKTDIFELDPLTGKKKVGDLNTPRTTMGPLTFS